MSCFKNLKQNFLPILRKSSLGLLTALFVPIIVLAVTTIGSNITTDGNLTISSTTATSTFSGDVVIQGTDIQFGNATTDRLWATGRFSSDLTPTTNNSSSFGAYANAWKDIYASGTIYGDTFNASGTSTFNGSLRASSTFLATGATTLYGRVDATYLNRRTAVPLLYQTIQGRRATTTVGTNPHGIAFDGTHMWVANNGSDNVSKIDISTNAVVATVTVGDGPRGIAFDGTHIWVANYNADTVSKIDISTNTVVATVTAGDGTYGVAFDGTHIWVANNLADTFSKIDISTNTVVATVTVGDGPISVAFDGTHMWVANFNADTVSKIDISTNTVVATVTVGDGPLGVTLAFDGTHIWVPNYLADTVSKIDISTNTVVATVTVDDGASDAAFDGTHIWVPNYLADTVSKIDISTNAVVVTVTAGDGPRGIAFDGTHIWVTNLLSHNVSKINIGGSFGANYDFNNNIRPITNNSFNAGAYGYAFQSIFASTSIRLGKQSATTTLDIASNSTSTTKGQGSCILLRATDGTLLYLSATSTPSASAPWTGLALSTVSCE